MTLNRRQLLRCCASLGVGGAFAANLAAFNAFAADTTDYKALVCVFLFGAMDNHDTVIPFDAESSADYEEIRSPLLTAYATPRYRADLLELAGASAPDGRTFGFPPEFAPLHDLFTQGRLAVVGNVGPLVEPTNRTSFNNDSVLLPPRLFSHNDQQSVWMSSQPEGAPFGWGGRFADLIDAASGNANAAFTSVSASGNTVFLTGQSSRAFQVSSTGAIQVNGLNNNQLFRSTQMPALYGDALVDLQGVPSSLFQADVVDTMQSSLAANATLEAGLSSAPTPSTTFPQSGLGAQLAIVAQMIAQRAPLGVNRQVFFVSTGGFDTHSDQATDLPGLQANIAASVRAFYDTLVEYQVADRVTTFTASDFGRTLSVNGDGTDHGWGAHHIVVGGAVQGGQILGDIPPAVLGHDQDAGKGRLIPTLAVDQYAAALGRWFGLSNSELADALPGLGQFDANALDGLLTT